MIRDDYTTVAEYECNDAGKLVKITYDDGDVEEFVYSGLGFMRKHGPKSPTGSPADWIKFTYWGSIVDSNLNPNEEIYLYNGLGAEAREEIFGYIEVFCNRHRMHSSLGYLSPVQFEALAVPKAP